ncbi:transposase [Pseudomonas putida]|nr:transposase [Pseudomonas putida]
MPELRERDVIEGLFGWLKEHRLLAARYCKLATSYVAMVTLACRQRCLRNLFRTVPNPHSKHHSGPRTLTAAHPIMISENASTIGAIPKV